MTPQFVYRLLDATILLGFAGIVWGLYGLVAWTGRRVSGLAQRK